MQDRIERKITIRASRERVFNAIVDPVQIVSWFPQTIEGEIKEGQQPIFGFGEKWGRYSVHVVKIQPYDYFAYRWVQTDDPGGFVGDVLAHPNTIVEFHLRDEGGSTVVTVTETGFSGLPEKVARRKFDENSTGWEQCFHSLQEFLEK